MKDPIFVRLHNDEAKIYDSYTDFWTLVDLSGFASVAQNEIDLNSDNDYVLYINNGNAKEIAMQPRRCRLILWQLERPSEGFDDRFLPQCYDESWVSDRQLYRTCADRLRGAKPIKYLPVGGHERLGGEPVMPKRYDAISISYNDPNNGRRSAIIAELKKRYGITLAPNGWGPERDRRLASSRVGLCLHQDNLRIIEPLRFTLFSCWKLPLVAEHSLDVFPYHTHSLEEIRSASNWLDNYTTMTRTLTFRHCVESAMGEAWKGWLA